MPQTDTERHAACHKRKAERQNMAISEIEELRNTVIRLRNDMRNKDLIIEELTNTIRQLRSVDSIADRVDNNISQISEDVRDNIKSQLTPSNTLSDPAWKSNTTSDSNNCISIFPPIANSSEGDVIVSVYPISNSLSDASEGKSCKI
jgi:hypothetical protein